MDYRLVAKAQQMGTLLHGEVGYLGDIHSQLVEVVWKSFLLHIVLKDAVAEPVSCQGDGSLVGLGAT